MSDNVNLEPEPPQPRPRLPWWWLWTALVVLVTVWGHFGSGGPDFWEGLVLWLTVLVLLPRALVALAHWILRHI